MRWWLAAWLVLYAADAVGGEWLLFNRCGYKPSHEASVIKSYEMQLAPNIGPILIRKDFVGAVVRIRKPKKLPPDVVICTILVDKSGEWVTVQGRFAEVVKRLGYEGATKTK